MPRQRVNELDYLVWSIRDSALGGLRIGSLDKHGQQAFERIQDEGEHLPEYGSLG